MELERTVSSLRQELVAAASDSASIVRERLTMAEERLYWVSLVEECSSAACRLVVPETFEVRSLRGSIDLPPPAAEIPHRSIHILK